MKRAWAIVEVLLAFAAMHVAFRAFKRFTALGQLETQAGMNFSPGVAMIVIALAFIAMRRRSPAANGLTLRPFVSSLNAAVLGLILLAACGGVLLALGAPLERPPTSLAGAILPVAANVSGTVLILWALQRHGARIDRMPRAIGLFLLIGVALLPIVAAAAQRRSVVDPLLTISWVLGGAGIGEEVFFRGYVQSRLNEAFERPWRIFGVPFGAGLLVAAALFGLVHVFNSADYFAGVSRFMWWHGLAAASTLFYGLLRERYGNVVAPALMHGFSDLLMRLPRLL